MSFYRFGFDIPHKVKAELRRCPEIGALIGSKGRYMEMTKARQQQNPHVSAVNDRSTYSQKVLLVVSVRMSSIFISMSMSTWSIRRPLVCLTQTSIICEIFMSNRTFMKRLIKALMETDVVLYAARFDPCIEETSIAKRSCTCDHARL